MKKDTGTTLLLLGGLAIGSYLLYKYLTGQQNIAPTPTPMIIPQFTPMQTPQSIFYQYTPPGQQTPVIFQPSTSTTFTPGATGASIGVDYRLPQNQDQAVVQAQQAGATVYAARIGSNQFAVAQPRTGNRLALLTTGTNVQQSTQAAIAPKIIRISGISRKVM